MCYSIIKLYVEYSIIKVYSIINLVSATVFGVFNKMCMLFLYYYICNTYRETIEDPELDSPSYPLLQYGVNQAFHTNSLFFIMFGPVILKYVIHMTGVVSE